MTSADTDPDRDGEVKTVGDEVRVLFNMFDKDRNGVVSRFELRRVLQELDPELWHNDAVDALLTGADRNKDGQLQFTEFWSWICGHGGSTKAEDDCRKVLLDNAIAHDRDRRAIARKQMEKDEARRREQEQKEADKVRKDAERLAGVRRDRPEFVKERVAIGMNKHVANDLFSKGDCNCDGDIDSEEMSWLNGEFIQTTKQIKGLYTEAMNVEDAANEVIMQEVLGIFDAWDNNGDGTISSEELCRVIKVLNPKLGQKTVEIMLKEADKNTDGVVDIMEFVSWLWGVNPKKKKDKEEQEARIALNLHRRRAAEARDQGLQKDFEKKQHEAVSSWCTKKKITMTCGALNPGPGASATCSECTGRHAWLCHNCGFVSFYPECVNGCSALSCGWSCISGKCPRTKCGCKKKPDYWQRYGFATDLQTLSSNVETMVKGGAAKYKDVRKPSNQERTEAKDPEEEDVGGEANKEEEEEKGKAAEEGDKDKEPGGEKDEKEEKEKKDAKDNEA